MASPDGSPARERDNAWLAHQLSAAGFKSTRKTVENDKLALKRLLGSNRAEP